MKTNPQKGVIEQKYLDKNLLPAGIDEVGRGCIAGPVVAACVVLDYQKVKSLDTNHSAKIRDSKTLSAKQRRELLDLISEISLDKAIGIASEREIESIGIAKATHLAMNRAIAQIRLIPSVLLVDGNQKISDQSIPQETIVKGDSLCFAIAAASIIAKEHRDQLMHDHAKNHSLWGFESHVGYGTADHLAAINSFGICDLHRKNFAPIRHMIYTTDGRRPNAVNS